MNATTYNSPCFACGKYTEHNMDLMFTSTPWPTPNYVWHPDYTGDDKRDKETMEKYEEDVVKARAEYDAAVLKVKKTYLPYCGCLDKKEEENKMRNVEMKKLGDLAADRRFSRRVGSILSAVYDMLNDDKSFDAGWYAAIAYKNMQNYHNMALVSDEEMFDFGIAISDIFNVHTKESVNEAERKQC